MIREIDPAHLDIHRAAGHAQRLAGYLFSTGAYMIAGSPVAATTKEDAIRELTELCEAMGFKLVKYASAISSNDHDYHLTLSKAAEIARKATGVVMFADGGSPGDEDSYRGYYSDLAFAKSETVKSASEFAKQCEDALGQTYQGYKGGNFRMDGSTPLWRAEYGCCGEAIVHAQINENGDLILFCKPEAAE